MRDGKEKKIDYSQRIVLNLIKNGQKQKSLRFLREILFFILENRSLYGLDEFSPLFILAYSFKNVSPVVGLRVQRRGRKRSYRPYVLTDAQSMHLIITWLIRIIKSSNNVRPLVTVIASEIFANFFFSGKLYKEYLEHHKYVMQHKR